MGQWSYNEDTRHKRPIKRPRAPLKPSHPFSPLRQQGTISYSVKSGGAELIPSGLSLAGAALSAIIDKPGAKAPKFLATMVAEASLLGPVSVMIHQDL